jgi:dolichol-phosphate mannosyltransferase
MPTYSFVVPIYNDGYLAEAFCAEFEAVFRRYLGTDDIAGSVELLFVNDGSADDSEAQLRAVCVKYGFARAIMLSRNFGQHIAVSCGYRHAVGDIVGMLNVDQEDPPSEIPVLLDAMRERGADIMYGLYQERRVSHMQRVTSALFTRTLNWLTGARAPTNMSTLRVMNRRFLDAYNSLVERSRFIPGLEQWLGFKPAYTFVRHQPRRVGGSSYNFRRRLRMATESIISFSDLPLRFAAVFGFCVAAAGLLLIAVLVVQKLFFVRFLPGFTSTISVIVFLGGLQIFVMGLASLYIGRILTEVQGRPLFLVRDTCNLTPGNIAHAMGTPIARRSS